MRHFRFLAAILLGLTLLCGSVGANQTPQTPKAEETQVKVWVNTQSSVYHCPGKRWYGATKHGKYMGECDARKAGNRAAYGKACGSVCK